MGMRVTTSMLVRMSIGNIGRQRARLAGFQEQASSGLRINRASDDPIGTASANMLRSRLETTSQMQRNVGRARSRMQTMESSLSSANNLMIRSRELATQAINGSISPEDRTLIAQEIEGLFEELITIGNTRFAGSHLFAGLASSTAPFAASGPFVDALPAPTVSFLGDSTEVQTEIDETVRVATTLDGRRVFLGDGDGNGAPDAGKIDLFDVLGGLRDALRTDDLTGLGNALSELDVAIGQLSVERTRIGVIEQRLQTQELSLNGRDVQLQTRLSEVQDADVAEVYTQLISQETALQAALQVTPRMIQPSLLDFLR